MKLHGVALVTYNEIPIGGLFICNLDHIHDVYKKIDDQRYTKVYSTGMPNTLIEYDIPRFVIHMRRDVEFIVLPTDCWV